jgi:hypothetical protein
VNGTFLAATNLNNYTDFVALQPGGLTPQAQNMSNLPGSWGIAINTPPGGGDLMHLQVNGVDAVLVDNFGNMAISQGNLGISDPSGGSTIGFDATLSNTALEIGTTNGTPAQIAGQGSIGLAVGNSNDAPDQGAIIEGQTSDLTLSGVLDATIGQSSLRITGSGPTYAMKIAPNYSAGGAWIQSPDQTSNSTTSTWTGAITTFNSTISADTAAAVEADGNADLNNYSTGVMIKNGGFSTAGTIMPVGKVAAADNADLSGAGNSFTVHNALCTKDAVILVTPTDGSWYAAQPFVTNVLDGSFDIKTLVGGGGTNETFNYFIITPINH